MNKLKSNHYSNLRLKTNVSSYFVIVLKGYESIIALDFLKALFGVNFDFFFCFHFSLHVEHSKEEIY